MSIYNPFGGALYSRPNFTVLINSLHPLITAMAPCHTECYSFTAYYSNLSPVRCSLGYVILNML